MCRDVGVTTPTATSMNSSTMTEKPPATAVAHTQTADAVKPAIAVAHTQTADTVKPAIAVAHTQTSVVIDVQPATIVATAAVTAPTTANVGTQSSRPVAVRTATVGVMAKPRTYDASVAAKPTLKHVGCLADATTDVKPATAPLTRATQTDAKDDRSSRNRTTQTEVATTVAWPDHATIGRRSNSFHHYTVAAAVDTTPPSPPVTSKIPRLKPVTPELNRKVLTRQDTYTKTEAEICTDDGDPEQHPLASSPPPPPTTPLETDDAR